MSKRNEIKALQLRWTPEALAAADLAFGKMDPVASIQRRAPQHPLTSPFGECDGFVDFRYLPLGVTPEYRTIERADLTGATDARRGQLGRCTLIGCRLDRAAMETNLGASVHRCSFIRAKFTHTVFRGEFEDCDFDHCDLSSSGGGQIRFRRCNFRNAKFFGAGFDYCHFEHCAWEGAKIGNAAFANCRFVGGWPNSDQLIQAMTPGAIFEEAVQ